MSIKYFCDLCGVNETLNAHPRAVIATTAIGGGGITSSMDLTLRSRDNELICDECWNAHVQEFLSNKNAPPVMRGDE